VSLPAVTPRIYASDEIQYVVYLRSLWFDGDLDFENDYRHFYDAGIARSAGFHETFLERTTETGRRINFAPVGCAILWTPFYALGDLAARLLRAAGADVGVDGYSFPYVAAVCYGSALYGLLALAISTAVARRLTGRGQLAALVIWIGTPLLFYTHVAPPMSHASSAFAVSLFVWTWLRVRERWSPAGLAGLGAAAALMAMVREQDAFFAAGPAIDYGRAIVRSIRAGDGRARQLLTGGLAGALAFSVAYVPQALAYLTLNGRLGPSRLVERKMTWTAPHALQVLVSPEHGLFLWTPLAIVALAGLVRLLRRPGTADAVRSDLRWIAGLALLMVALQVYVAGSVESWTVAGAFGQRRFVGLTVLLTTGLAALFASIRRRGATAVLTAATILCVWWNAGLIVQFGAGLMDRQRLEPGRNAYNTFVVVPGRLPAIAFRYLFDRASFYQPPEVGR
jgi:hypothetical protein